MSEQGSWYFSAPWEPVLVRRGDALGLRAGADYFANILAPGLNNGTSDARWISILSWCLKWSHVVWTSAGGRDLSRLDYQLERYAWLRPLELLWVDRTLEAGQATGQLRGRRSIERWRRADRKPPNFAMSADQFRRYRQVGTYGAYRVVFRTVPGLTKYDGWTPDETALALADLVNDSLPRDVRLMYRYFESGTKWAHWKDGGEARYWLEHGWPDSWKRIGGFLPTPEEAFSKRLPTEERRLLAPLLFEAGTPRRVTAEVLALAKSAKSHADLCDALASSSDLTKMVAPASLEPLPAFSRFADAAMHAMRGLWDHISKDETAPAPAVEKVARATELQARFDLLRIASEAWLRAPGRRAFPHEQFVTRLAESIRDSATPLKLLQTLVTHHSELGGGRRWFRERAGKLVPLVDDTGITASDYRFRLRPLIQLAAQCGVANMDVALKAASRSEFKSVSGHESEDQEDDLL